MSYLTRPDLIRREVKIRSGVGLIFSLKTNLTAKNENIAAHTIVYLRKTYFLTRDFGDCPIPVL